MKARLIFLINSLGLGGAERVLAILLNKLVKEYDCSLILLENQICYQLDSRVQLIILNEKSEYNGVTKLLRLPILAYKLSKIIEKNNFKKITSFLTRSNYLNVLSKLFSKHEIILSEHSILSEQYNHKNLKSLTNKFLVSLLYRHSDKIITVSKYCKYDLYRNFNIKENVYTVYNPIDITIIDNLKNDETDVCFNKFTFATIGRLDEAKNHKLMIDAIRGTDANLLIIGGGFLKKNIEKHIKKLKLEDQVFLLGQQSNPFKYLSKCDGFILASRYESFGLVLIEALACELPVISTDCPSGPREILAPGSSIHLKLKDKIELAEYGILVPENNTKKLKEAIKLVLEDKYLRERYKRNARQRINDFHIYPILEKYKKLLI